MNKKNESYVAMPVERSYGFVLCKLNSWLRVIANSVFKKHTKWINIYDRKSPLWAEWIFIFRRNLFFLYSGCESNFVPIPEIRTLALIGMKRDTQNRREFDSFALAHQTNYRRRRWQRRNESRVHWDVPNSSRRHRYTILSFFVLSFISPKMSVMYSNRSHSGFGARYTCTQKRFGSTG